MQNGETKWTEDKRTEKKDWTQQRRTVKNVLHQANCERSNMESKIKGRVERKNNTPEPQLTQKNKKFRLNNRITAQKNKPTTKFKLQQPCRNSECRVLLWSVHLLIRSLTAGGQKSRYVSYVTFGTSICLWSSNRQIIVCVPLKKKKKKRRLNSTSL